MEAFFACRLTGVPNEMVVSMEDKHVLEQWRALCQFCRPTGATTSIHESRMLISPPRAKNLGELLPLIANWKMAEKRVIAATGEKLSQTTRIHALYQMCTASLEQELVNQSDRLTSFDLIENHIRVVVHHRLQPQPGSHQKPVFSLSEEVNQGDEQVELEGELCWLRTGKDGKRVVDRSGGGRAPLRTAKAGDACWKCDRKGHYGRDCTHPKKANGDPLNPHDPSRIRNRVPAGNLETAQEPPPAEMPLTSICINALDAITGPKYFQDDADEPPTPLAADAEDDDEADDNQDKADAEEEEEDGWKHWDPWIQALQQNTAAAAAAGNPGPPKPTMCKTPIDEHSFGCSICQQAGIYHGERPTAPVDYSSIDLAASLLDESLAALALSSCSLPSLEQCSLIGQEFPSGPPSTDGEAAFERISDYSPDFWEIIDDDFDAALAAPEAPPMPTSLLQTRSIEPDAVDPSDLPPSSHPVREERCAAAIDSDDDDDDLFDLTPSRHLVREERCAAMAACLNFAQWMWSVLVAIAWCGCCFCGRRRRLKDQDESAAEYFVPLNALNSGGAADGVMTVPDVTVDTGAGASCANPSMFPHCPVEPSPGSKAGQVFVGPDGGTMANQGQIRPNLLLENGAMGGFCFQAADKIRKPLLAVSEVNRKGNPCWFDGRSSFILPAGAPELAQIRRLINKVALKVPLHLTNGVFTMKAWQPEDGQMGPNPFARPGM